MLTILRMYFNKYKIYIFIGTAIGLFAFGGYGGYKLSEAKWLARQAGAEAKYREEQERLTQKLSEAERIAVVAKQQRKVEYREKKIYITKSIPECPPIDSDRLHELQCITSPSKCQR